MASLMSLLTGHRPGAFEGFQMKDLFDKDRWERRQRQVQNPRFAEEGLPPQMTNWYKGRGTPEANVIKTRDAGGAPIYQGPQQQANAKLFPLRPSPRVQAQALSDPLSSGAKWGGGAALLPERMQTRTFVPPLDIATEEEVEAMNAYRNQMLTDLLAETSEGPEVKAISYYKKKKRLPKTYRSQSRGYRLKRI
mgnify:CR=1 FL=1